MFGALTDKLTGIFDRLKGRGALLEADVDAALREIRLALLEADGRIAIHDEHMAEARVLKDRARPPEFLSLADARFALARS